MLKNEDINFLNKKCASYKGAFLMLVSEYGPNFDGRFSITYEEIKAETVRQRLTQPTLQRYLDYLANQGFIAELSMSEIRLNINAYTFIGAGESQVSLAEATQTFRTRAQLQGDINNY